MMIEKNKLTSDKLRTIRSYLAAFFVPMLIFVVAIAIGGWNENGASILESDVDGQYVSFLTYYKSVFSAKNNLFYSLSYGIGGSMYGLSAYYLLSPFNLIALFFRESQMPYAIVVIALLKIGMAASFMNLYLRGKKENRATEVFAIAYGLCAYTAVYYFNIMWLDGVVFLPLVIHNLENVIQKKKHSIRYVISLSIAIIADYYLGWMVCAFTFFFFLYKCFVEKGTGADLRKRCLWFAYDSGLAAGISAVVLLPVLFVMKNSGKVMGIPELDFSFVYNPLKLFRQFTFWAVTDKQTAIPNIFCGTILSVGMLFFFVSKEIKKREKVVSAVFLIILFGSSVMLFPNLVWHAMNYSNGYPYRYAFVFSFVIIELSYKAFCQETARRFSKKVWMVIGGVQLLELALFWCVHVGTGVNSVANYKKDVRKTEAALAQIDCDNVVRIEKSYHRTWADPMQMGYYGMSSSSSTTSSAVGRMLQKFGIHNINNAVNIEYHEGMSVFSDCFWGIRYYLALDDWHTKGYQVISRAGDVLICENKNAFPILYAVPNDVEMTSLNGENAFEVQNYVATGIGSEEIIYQELSFEKEEAEESVEVYALVSLANGRVYFDYSGLGVERTDYIELQVNDHEKQLVTCQEYNSIDLGYYEAGENLIVTVKKPGKMKVVSEHFYYEDGKAIEKLAEKFEKQSIVVKEATSSRYEAEINVTEENSGLLMTFPFDKGWSIAIDGQNVEYTYAFDELIFVPDVSAGKHEISMRYTPRGYKIGWMMSLFCIVAMIVPNVIETIVKKGKDK